MVGAGEHLYDQLRGRLHRHRIDQDPIDRRPGADASVWRFDWFMPYVTGGAALVDGLNNLTMTVAGTTASFAPLSHSTLGWTAGEPASRSLCGAIGLRSSSTFMSAPTARPSLRRSPMSWDWATVSTPGDYRDNIVRVGFNYRFGPRGGPGVLESPLPVRDAFAWNSRFSAEPAVCDRPGERAGRGGQPSKKSGPSSGQAGRHAGCRSSGRAGSERSGTGREASRRPEASSSTASRLRHKRAAVLDGR